MKRIAAISILVLLGLAACGKPYKKGGFSGATDTSSSRKGGNSATEDQTAEDDSTMLTCNATAGRTYKGFGGIELTAGRVLEIPALGDRFRIKPYTALANEFQRVTGSVPRSLTANAATFAAAPDRWYVEPLASAVTLFTTYRVAYEASLTYAGTDPKFSTAPTDSTAASECLMFARLAWNRMPKPEEVKGCQQIAVVDTAAEADAKTRWAYAFASILSATGFIAY